MVAHAFNPSTWEAEAGRFLSSRIARATQRNHVSKKQKNKNKNKTPKNNNKPKTNQTNKKTKTKTKTKQLMLSLKSLPATLHLSK